MRFTCLLGVLFDVDVPAQWVTYYAEMAELGTNRYIQFFLSMGCRSRPIIKPKYIIYSKELKIKMFCDIQAVPRLIADVDLKVQVPTRTNTVWNLFFH